MRSSEVYRLLPLLPYEQTSSMISSTLRRLEATSVAKSTSPFPVDCRKQTIQHQPQCSSDKPDLRPTGLKTKTERPRRKVKSTHFCPLR
jgi:hypothetical protein